MWWGRRLGRSTRGSCLRRGRWVRENPTPLTGERAAFVTCGCELHRGPLSLDSASVLALTLSSYHQIAHSRALYWYLFLHGGGGEMSM